MTEDLGKGLQIKTQDEIISKERSFKKPANRKTSNNIAYPSSEEEQFVNALTSPWVSPVSNNNVVEKFNQLNSDFKQDQRFLQKKIPIYIFRTYYIIISRKYIETVTVNASKANSPSVTNKKARARDIKCGV
ncbi:hypothetical protein C1646_664960 [Rhizophagus diaphanus]|nr:hypothetical protein C1646_664960 [Rhizophagus diaphanus] [Rhizophagus sp. MUCL 43196]